MPEAGPPDASGARRNFSATDGKANSVKLYGDPANAGGGYGTTAAIDPTKSKVFFGGQAVQTVDLGLGRVSAAGGFHGFHGFDGFALALDLSTKATSGVRTAGGPGTTEYGYGASCSCGRRPRRGSPLDALDLQCKLWRMKSSFWRCGALFFALSAWACSSHGFPANDADSGSVDDAQSSGGAKLAVDAVAAYTSLTNVQPKHGMLVVASVTLSNDGAAHPLATNPLYFSLSLPDHTLVAASPFTSTLDDACDASVAVDDKGHASCSVMFDVDPSAAPNAVVYADPAGPTATASIGALPTAGPPDDATWGSISQTDRATLCSSVKPALGQCNGDPMLMIPNMDLCSAPKPDSMWPVEDENTFYSVCTLATIDPKATIADVKSCIAATNAQVCAAFSDAACTKILSWTVSGSC